MKHKPGRRYGCPCNADVVRCACCTYCASLVNQGPSAWPQIVEMIKQAKHDPAYQEERRKIWDEVFPDVTTEAE